MSNVGLHAKRELEILSATETDPNNRPIIEEFKDEIIALCEKFGNSGQSGGSAPYVAKALSQAIKHLCMFEVIAPLTGNDDEWNDVSDLGNGELMVSPRGYIKSFPFTPKTFYIDVIEEEVAKDGWEMYVKDISQLDEVWAYYDKA